MKKEQNDEEAKLLEAFTCPISQSLIEDPVSSKYGHIYEKSEITRWVTKYKKCPMTSQPLQLSELFPNFAVRDAIAEYKRLKTKIDQG